MNQSKSDQVARITELVEELGFHPLAAKTYVECNGKCGYCGLDLLEQSIEYNSGVIDRILPMGKYLELEWNENNLILSCYSCSHLKADFDVLDGVDGNPLNLLNKCKPILISNIMAELSKRLQAIEYERIRVKHIIRG